MIRTRMLWFSLGFASASASIAHFIHKDIWFDRNSIASEMKEKFKSLDGRVSNLESVLSRETNAPRVRLSLLEHRIVAYGLLITRSRMKKLLDEASNFCS